MHRSVPFTELAALYSIADACLLTSTRDGMNLVSFEYVACQADRHGVLILSEFAGAASFMQEGSICFHPANKTEMSEAIYAALHLDPAERKRKHEYLRDFVNEHTRSVPRLGNIARSYIGNVLIYGCVVRDGVRSLLKS